MDNERSDGYFLLSLVCIERAFLTTVSLYLIFFSIVSSSIMKNLSTTLKRAFLVLGIIGVAVLVCTPAGAGEYEKTFGASGSDFHVRSDPSDNHSGNASSDHVLIVSLTQSVSLDLKLSSVDTGQAPTGEKQSSAPPIPIPKAPGSDLRYSRLGVGLSFKF